MSEENISQEFRLNKTDEIKNYLIEETNQNELMSKKHKNVYSVLNYIDHLLMVTFKLLDAFLFLLLLLYMVFLYKLRDLQ